ncbi:MAG TPA: hypothetical protein P5218_00185 [Planctomycetota bacterium]|nr:hypothetical protein [Planctomycetota bacterium]HPF12887.1 hypothetical protein [Planctomycetota bacterium]HRV79817.1 hypothetical protein [Planctomycetota bacterium]
MTEQLGTAHICPTRIDGESALFAHQVTRGQCQSRQRDSFHKCFTCVHNNAYAAAHRDRQVVLEAKAPAQVASRS